MSLEDTLSKIRPHTSSNLAHQKAPAQLLLAIESTLQPDQRSSNAAAYFGALLACLESTVSGGDGEGEMDMSEGARTPAILYLMAFILPHVSPSVLRSSSNLGLLLPLLTKLYSPTKLHAPAYRSFISIAAALVEALSGTESLETHGLKSLFMSLVDAACGDPRPKVRKKASEGVHGVLAAPAPSLHPYAASVRSFILPKLSITEGDGIIHTITFLRSVISFLPFSDDGMIQKVLLLQKMGGDTYVKAAAYALLGDLLSREGTEGDGAVKTLLSNAPNMSDVAVSVAWVGVFTTLSLGSSSNSTSSNTDAEFEKIFRAMFSYVASLDGTLQRATAGALGGFITTNFLLSTAESAGKVVQLGQAAITDVAYTHCIPSVLQILASLLLHFPDTSPLPMEISAVISKVATLRTSPKFMYKEAADGVLKSALKRFGPEAVLGVVELNLDIEKDRKTKETRTPHAYLLPLLASLTAPYHPSSLTHFISYFVPLSERMFNYKTQTSVEAESKMWDVLIGQIWDCFAGYCFAKEDLSVSWTPQFSQLLSTLLYSQASLRTGILRGLRVVVESNSSTSLSTRSQKEREKNVEFLRGQAESWFGVLFNLFGSVRREERGGVGDVVRAWGGIAGTDVLKKTLSKIIAMLTRSLPHAGTEHKGGQRVPNEAAGVVGNMCDLILIFLDFPVGVGEEERRQVWSYFSRTEDEWSGVGKGDGKLCVLQCEEMGVRKRAWRVLARVLEHEAAEWTLDEVESERVIKFEEPAGGAKRDRLAFLQALLPHIARTSLHLIPSLIPEAVLGTKEPAERTRRVAFELVVAMGRKMAEGGVVRRAMIVEADGMMDGDDTEREVEASLEEYVVMLSAGLAGATPHMISASVMAVSRVVFEFKDNLKPETLNDLLATLILFLTSTNREIIKSTLGFIKLAIHTLPPSLLSSHLSTLIPNLLVWAKDYKNHFKVRVQHIFERMMRVFGAEQVMSYVQGSGDEEGRKVLDGVRRRRERAKKKKKASRGREDDEEGQDHLPSAPKRPTTSGDAFEDVLYGSESDSDNESGDEEAVGKNGPKTSRQRQGAGGAQLRLDDDEPMDLLEGAGSHLDNNRKTRRKPGQEASKFKTEKETGKMLIADSDSDIDASAHRPPTVAAGGSAYLEALTSSDGFTRGANGHVKFNKNTKKRRLAEAEMEAAAGGADGDVEMTDASHQPKKAKRKEKKLGHEFKAKKAGGDVKRGGVEPYAYLPLGQAARHQKPGKGKMGIAGKR